MLSNLLTRRPAPGSPIPMARVRKLGTVRGTEFVTIDKAEYALSSTTVEKPDDLAGATGSVIIAIPRIARDDSGHEMTTGSSYQLAEPVPSGSYAALLAKRVRTAPAQQPLDALDVIGMLAARQPRIIGVAHGSSSAVSLRGSGAGMVEGRPAVRGRAILELLQGRGVTLAAAVDGRLLASAPGGHADEDVRALISMADRLLAGFVSGHPLACELRHDGKPDEAWTVAVGGLLMCQGHADGTVES